MVDVADFNPLQYFSLFTFYFFQEPLSGVVTTVLGTTPLALVVFFGGAQNCLSKAAKYSVFDTTKEKRGFSLLRTRKDRNSPLYNFPDFATSGNLFLFSRCVLFSTKSFLNRKTGSSFTTPS